MDGRRGTSMPRNPVCHSGRERGVAIIAALLILFLLSAAAMGLMFMSAGESSLVGNQRSSTLVWDAGFGGLEEARARLSNVDPSFLGLPGTSITFPAAPGDVLYILNNPGSAFSVTDVTTSTSPYYDWEYDQEWGTGSLATAKAAGKIQTKSSDVLLPSLTGMLPPIPYAWVRVTILTERAAARDINSDGTLDASMPVYFDGSNENLNHSGGAVYRLTSLAVLSTGASSMVQYDAGPGMVVPAMPGALTLCGPNVTWGPPSSNNWEFNGSDHATPTQPAIEGIATCSSTANSTITSNLPKPANYTGKGATPDVVNDSSTMGTCVQSVTCLNSLVITLTASAGQVFYGTSAPPTPMGTDASPLITVVADNTTPSWAPGNTSSCDGAGILVVTGTLTCAGGSSFDGMILVVGQGVFNISGGGNGAFNGAFLVAKTRDSLGNLLSTLGNPTFTVSGGGNNSMNYNSQFENMVRSRFPYKVLAFRAIGH